ncbi:hypothetical protein A0H81_02027 [Grifola frondosa]|uniref:Uncharacterized protein n=1 Tax=Grifola frondosa TaxID=5627 RepID=A0A1C7MQ12_GRIFR|nr:hypothetical protein A0H81_02027 [Grifola frondosa]
MSSLTVAGFFCLAAGHRTLSVKPSGSKAWHCFYNTAVQCSDGSSFPAELRIYSPLNDTPLVDNTVAFVVAKAHFPKHAPVLLDAYHVVAVPGDPGSDTYDDGIPDLQHPLIFGLGNVSRKFDVLPGQNVKAFEVLTTEYVRDTSKSSTIDGVRWSNTPLPLVNTTVQFFGSCTSVCANGNLRVNVDNIVLNVGPPAGGAGGPPPPDGGNGPSTPKCKHFQAFASPASATSMSPSGTLTLPSGSGAIHSTLDDNMTLSASASTSPITMTRFDSAQHTAPIINAQAFSAASSPLSPPPVDDADHGILPVAESELEDSEQPKRASKRAAEKRRAV